MKIKIRKSWFFTAIEFDGDKEELDQFTKNINYLG